MIVLEKSSLSVFIRFSDSMNECLKNNMLLFGDEYFHSLSSMCNVAWQQSASFYFLT